MKKILCSAVVACSVAGLVRASDSMEFGVLKVPSSEVETIVAVPWLASSTGTVAVKVADLVLTAGLNDGDELKFYNGSKYECWQLKTVGEVKQWVASTEVSDAGVGKVDAAQDKAIERGYALILKRGAPIASAFYIMGKPDATSSEISLLSNGYTLVAPPFVTDTDVNTALTWTNIENGKDQLIVPTDSGYMNLQYISAKGGWCKRSGKSWTSEGVMIPAGKGAWFVSTATTTGKKVSW